MSERRADVLRLERATGVWAVRSFEQPPYFVDADAFAVGRMPLLDAAPSPFDGRWLLIRSIAGPRDRFVVRAGDWHIYRLSSWTDPGASSCWYQGPAVAIELATGDELAALPVRLSSTVKTLSWPDGPDGLVVAVARGVWAVRSSSDTVYYVDGDAQTLLRRPGSRSSRGPGDGRWVPLLQVRAMVAGDTGVIRVGDRHEYALDVDPRSPNYWSWIQRLVMSVAPVDETELATLPSRTPGGAT